jgi:thiol:disulfide interchange protein DsbA
MKRRDFAALIAAGSGLSLAEAQGGPVEGRHYSRLSQPAPTTAPAGKIEVIEFFWYGCPHCNAFEPAIEAWAKQLPADVVYRKSHVAFRANVKIHQRMFFALESMGVEAKVRPAIFEAIHVRNLGLDSKASQAKFLASLGVDSGKYEQAYDSMGVITRCQQAEQLSERYDIDGVPAIGIGGRFMTSPSRASGGVRMSEEDLGRQALAVTDFLINRIRNKA